MYSHLLIGEKKRRGRMYGTLAGPGPASAAECRSPDGSSEDTTHFGDTGLTSATRDVLEYF